MINESAARMDVPMFCAGQKAVNGVREIRCLAPSGDIAGRGRWGCVSRHIGGPVTSCAHLRDAYPATGWPESDLRSHVAHKVPKARPALAEHSIEQYSRYQARPLSPIRSLP